jgi:dienelactone hydrolase
MLSCCSYRIRLRTLIQLVWLSALPMCAAAQIAPVHIDRPAGAGPFPAVVLAPGQGYHMALPAMAQTAAELVERGFAVYRFNWSYWLRDPKGEPADNLVTELQDLQRVIKLARTDPTVDGARLGVAGKSLGSVVAWQALRADAALSFAVLLTPVCSEQVVGSGAASAAAANYPDIETEARPLAFVLGDADPLCEPKLLYRHAAQAKGPVRIDVVSGDHSFRSAEPDPKQREEALQRNLAAASKAVADFAAQAIRPAAKP